MGKDRGWDYLNSSGNDFDYDKDNDGSWGYENEDGSGSFYGSDGSWGYKNSDGSASYHGVDGSWGYKNSDGSGSYYGNDGSWGYINSDGNGSYYGSDEESEYYNSEDDNDYSESDAGGSLLGTLIGIGIAAFAIFKLAKSSSDYSSCDDEDDNDEEDDNGDEYDYYNSEEYQVRMREKAQYRAEEQRIKKEQRKEKRRQILGTITRKKVQAGISAIGCKGKQSDYLVDFFRKQGFFNISTSILEDLPFESINQEGFTEGVTINGERDFDTISQFPINAKIEIVYHKLLKVIPPMTSRRAKRKNYNEVVNEFRRCGFVNISVTEITDLSVGWIVKDGAVEKVLIDGRVDYKRNERIRIDAHIVVNYHTFKKK